MRSTEPLGPLHIVSAANCADDDGTAPGGQLCGDGSHPAGGPGDQHGDTLYGPVGKDRSMCSEAGNAEACPLVEGDFVGKSNCLPRRHRHILRRRAERAIRLRTEAPHTFADARLVHIDTHGVDLSRPIALGDDARIRHR
jgi:hypothetical protein